jgi:DNA-binding response OmpR family regulator
MSKPLVLVVEDDDATAELLTDLLHAEGYDARTLSTPKGVDAVRCARPDLILLDLIFPDSKGEDLLLDLRRTADLSDLPVVLLSAMPHLADAAAQLPVQGYVSKPFDMDHLLCTIGRLLWRPAAEAPSDLRCSPAGSLS